VFALEFVLDRPGHSAEVPAQADLVVSLGWFSTEAQPLPLKNESCSRLGFSLGLGLGGRTGSSAGFIDGNDVDGPPVGETGVLVRVSVHQVVGFRCEVGFVPLHREGVVLPHVEPHHVGRQQLTHFSISLCQHRTKKEEEEEKFCFLSEMEKTTTK